MTEYPAVGEAIDVAVREVNGEAGRPESFDALHELLEAQAYRLSYWRTASHEINYRRFFDVNQLAGLRVEDPEVFAATHTLLNELIEERPGPGRAHRPSGRPLRSGALLRHAPGPCRRRLIRARRKDPLRCARRSPRKWQVAGTTGYNYLNELNGIFVKHAELSGCVAPTRN